MESIRKQARFAGLLYFLMGITAPIGLEIVPGRLIVRGDALATADHLRVSETLYRIGIASELFHQALAVYLVLALYRLFKAVNERQAVQMVILSLVGIPIMFVGSVHELGALVLVSHPDFLSRFAPDQLDGLAYLFIRLHNLCITVASIFWGLWLFPFAMLVIRSGFIPRLLGYLMIVAGVGYLVSSTVSVLLPQYGHAVGQIAMILEIGEVPIIFWLLIWGAKERPAAATAT